MSRLSLMLAGLLLVGCGEEAAGPDLPDGVATLVSRVTAAAGVAAALGGPLGMTVRMLGMDTTKPLSDAEVQKMVEQGVTTGPVVKDKTCVSFSWSGLTGTALMPNCVTWLTGLPLSAGVVIKAKHKTKAQLELTLNKAKVGTDYVTGTIKIDLVGVGTPVITAQLQVGGGDGSVAYQLTLQAVHVSGGDGVGATSLNGLGSLLAAGQEQEVDLDSPAWQGLCLPLQGSLSYKQDGEKVTVTFTANTPLQGKVRVKQGSKPEVNVKLLTPCKKP